jgi:hypothetical protein
MIQYALKCADGHAFDSWFQSASAYDKLAAARMVACVICGSDEVEKALMAPRVSQAPPQSADQTADKPGDGALSRPATAMERALAALRKRVEETSDYVGDRFATEARAIHDGTAPDRPIYGEARIDEARDLIAEGLPVAPLPFRPNRNTN